MAKRSDKEENNDTDEDIDIQEEVNEKEENIMSFGKDFEESINNPLLEVEEP